MSQYKGQQAWDDTRLEQPGAAGTGPAGPSPAAERQEGYELGNIAITDMNKPGGSPRRGGSKLPWLLLVLVLIGAGALAFTQYLPLRRSLDEKDHELALAADGNAKLTARLQQLEKQAADLAATKDELQLTVQMKEQALAELTKTQDELTGKLQAEIAKGDVLINQRAGELVVDLVDQILFDSGEAELNAQGQAVLKKVGETFAKVADKVIQVGGHTDNVPISPKLISKFPTNWELSATRATNVVRFLEDECKIPGTRLVAAGFSQFRPVAGNSNKNGRRRNRRIEVVLLPVPPGAKGAKSGGEGR